MSKCYNLDGTNPDLRCRRIRTAQIIQRNATTGGVDTVATPYFNLGGLHTSGIDAQIDWKIPVGPAASI